MLDTNTKSAVSFQAVFFRFDKDQSGDMNLFELRDALKSLGSYVPVASFFLKFYYFWTISFYCNLFLPRYFLPCRISTQ